MDSNRQRNEKSYRYFGWAISNDIFNCGLDMAKPKAIQSRFNHCKWRALDYSQHSPFYSDTQHTMPSNCVNDGSYTTVTITLSWAECITPMKESNLLQCNTYHWTGMSR
eukprot:15334279-Ditylum_brightwellii.AAC.1